MATGNIGDARISAGDTLAGMPTTRRRHVVTESDELAAALDAQARRWPTLSRGQLVARLAIEGARLSQERAAQESRRRREAIAKAGTILSGTDAASELRAMREQDWPA